jgi:hypothetical protein
MRLRLILTPEQVERLKLPVTTSGAVASLLHALLEHLEMGRDGWVLVLEEPLARQVLKLAEGPKRDAARVRSLGPAIRAKLKATLEQQTRLFEE